ncbi:MAG TPA: serine hydrolase domain-containing protein [Croceibacterium sp.]|nr:serine hydrolase domain-containing protein [Croceibacterium sp.]
MALAEHLHFTRRQWLAGSVALGAGAALGEIPAWAQSASSWPSVRNLVARYTSGGKVANMVASLGVGDAAPALIASGLDSFGGQRRSDGRSLYRIYSMTKPVTGMAAAMLIDEGKLGLDQPLHDILPRYRDMQVQKVYDGPIGAGNLEPAVRPITMRHLLTHTSGLGYGIVQSGPLMEAYFDRGIVPALFTRLQIIPQLRATPAPSLEIFADRLADMPLVYQPGTRWSYSMGLDVMGRVIEVVTGQPFDRFLQERFFDPLGMADTGFQARRADADRMTTNYFILGGRLLPVDPGGASIFYDKPPFPFGGAGLVSTPADYDRFLQMLLGYGQIGGKRIMSERAVRLGISDLLPDTLSPQDEYSSGPWGFGAGGRVGRGDEEGVYGWAGAAGTIGFVHFPSNLRAGLYTQYMPMESYPLLEEFPNAIRADIASGNAA